LNKLNVLSIWFDTFFFLIAPNIFKIIKKKLNFTSRVPVVEQKVLITGNGEVTIGNGCSFGYKLGGFNRQGVIEIQPRYKSARILFGDNVKTNNNLFLCSANYIEIGSKTLIGLNVVIMDHDAHGSHPEERQNLGSVGKVIIGKNVWIGNNVTILKDSFIGDNTIVALGAVVSGKFPSNVIIGGIPAKIIKRIDAS
jgi:acetyltransferase-like isoleucine patch superfamily enzyme